MSSFATYLVVSASRIALGSNYPSDCLMSFPAIVLILLAKWVFTLIDRQIELCPLCEESYFCYYGETGSPATVLITRSSIDIWNLNLATNLVAFFMALLATCILNYPFNYWNKLNYFVASCTAIWLFQNMLLCPNAGTEFQGVYQPSMSKNYPAVQQ